MLRVIEEKKVPGGVKREKANLRGIKSSSCLAKLQRRVAFWQDSGGLSSTLGILNFILREIGNQKILNREET